MDESASPFGKANLFGLLGFLFTIFNYKENNVFNFFLFIFFSKKQLSTHTYPLVGNLGCSPTYNYWKPTVDARNPLMLLLKTTP
jgi:hypothetical protein